LFGGSLTVAAQFAGFLLVVASVGGQLFAEALDRFVIGIEAFQFFQQLLVQVGQFARLYAVLARQGVDGVQALLQHLLAFRIGVEMVDEAIELTDRLFDLDLRAGEQVDRLAQRLRLILEGGQPLQAAGQGGKHVAGITLATQLHDLAAGAEQLLGVGQVLVFLFELLQFVLAEREILQLFQLIAEQLVACALLVAAVAQPFQGLARLPPALRGQLHLARQVLAAAVLVEQAPVGVGLEQRLVLVLAVNVDQQFAQRLEITLRAGCAIDVAARAALGGDHSAQDAGAFAVHVAFGQPGAGVGDVVQVEAGEDVGLVRTDAHHAAVGPVAEGQAEGIEHDRFARAGFTADHAHAAFQLEVQVFDDGVVVNRQMNQHGKAPDFAWLAIYTVFFLLPTSAEG